MKLIAGREPAAKVAAAAAGVEAAVVAATTAPLVLSISSGVG